MGQEIVLHRNHYLNFDPRRTWTQLERAGFKWDFSVGFNDKMGFRCGIASPYKAFDLNRKRVLNLRLVPLIFMDGAFSGISQEKIIKELRVLLEKVKAVGGTVSILFHPDRFAMGREAWELFVKVIDLCESLEAEMGELNFLK